MKIPRVIHQTWKDSTIPEEWRSWQESWKTHHPAWDYHLWTHAEIDHFIHTHYPGFYERFRNLPLQIMRVDTFRAFLMLQTGGLYVDLDFECLQPLEPLLGEHACVLGKEPYEHARQLYLLDWVPGSAFLASVPGHPFWGHYLRCIFAGNCQAANPIYATGPAMLKRALDTYTGDPEGITLLEPHLLYPLPNLGNKRLRLADRWRASRETNATAAGFPGAFAVHRWQHSWLQDLPVKPAAGPGPGNAGLSPELAARRAKAPAVDEIIQSLASLRTRADYLVICRDRVNYHGMSINKATAGLFGEEKLVMPEYCGLPVYSTRELNAITGAVVDLGFNQVVLSGFPPFYGEIVLQIKCKKPQLPLKVLFHAFLAELSYSQQIQGTFKTLVTLCRKKLVNLVGFNKRDLAETIGKLFNINTFQYYLYTRQYHWENGPHLPKPNLDIGVFVSSVYRKNIHNQVAAALMLDRSLVHLHDNQEVDYFLQQDRIKTHPFIDDPVDFAGLLSSMDVNFYVTFSESWGLIISESLIHGVPCLAGNTSGLFDFHELLKSYLVVNEADNPMAIYQKALKVLENYDQIKQLGKKYIHYLNELALKKKSEFLSL
jgi:glycosyltransferase involved in cell wall biosynthesis